MLYPPADKALNNDIFLILGEVFNKPGLIYLEPAVKAVHRLNRVRPFPVESGFADCLDRPAELGHNYVFLHINPVENQGHQYQNKDADADDNLCPLTHFFPPVFSLLFSMKRGIESPS